MLITKAAADILRDPDAPAAQVAVAVVALSEAVRQGIEVPLDAGLLLWGAVERSPTTSWAADATEAIGLLARRPLVERIMTSIIRHDASRELRRVGLDVLAAPRAVTHVTDAELLALVEVVRGRQVAALANVILGAAEVRKVEPGSIRMIVDRWCSLADPQERIAVLDLVELLAHEDAVRIVERLLLRDPSPKVRELAALHIEDVLDAEDALGMIDRALAAEEHWGVVAELTRARAEMLANTGDTQNRPVTFSSS